MAYSDMSNTDPTIERLYLDVEFSLSSNIFDLSGKIPFFVNVDYARRRWQETAFDPIEIDPNGTILDISSALLQGTLTLQEAEGDYPDEDWSQCSKTMITQSSLLNGEGGITLGPKPLIRLESVSRAHIVSPRRIKCILDPAIVANLKAGKMYCIRFPAEASRRRDPWSGGIESWRTCTDDGATSDIATSAFQHEVKVWKIRSGLLFKALRDPPRPPRIDYEIGISPSKLSLADINKIKLTVKFQLREQNPYTVMCQVSDKKYGPHDMVLAPGNVSNHCFDLYDTVSGILLSTKPSYLGATWSDELPTSQAISQSQLRELVPDQTYTSESVLWDRGMHAMSTFAGYFRVPEEVCTVGRKLSVRLRPIRAYWSTKPISGLFEHTDTIYREHWFIPLWMESEASAEFTLVE